MLPASGGLFDLDALDESIAENEQKMAEPGFWDDNVAAQKVINAMFSAPLFENKEWWRIKFYLTDFTTKSNDFYALLLLILICAITPNSNWLLQKISQIKNKKIVSIMGIVMALVTFLLLSKMVIIPYSEFIYFNF